jgi:hypothetical protein
MLASLTCVGVVLVIVTIVLGLITLGGSVGGVATFRAELLWLMAVLTGIVGGLGLVMYAGSANTSSEYVSVGVASQLASAANRLSEPVTQRGGLVELGVLADGLNAGNTGVVQSVSASGHWRYNVIGDTFNYNTQMACVLYSPQRAVWTHRPWACR